MSLKTLNESLERLFLLESKADTEKFRQWLDKAYEDYIEDFDFLRAFKEEEDNEKLFNWFENHRKNLKSPQNNYYYWIKDNEEDNKKSYIELVHLKIEQQQKQEVSQKEKDGAKLIYKDNDWYVYHITNYEASCKYGANTKWCITATKRWEGDGRDNWDNYEKQGIKMYFFIDRKNNEKYALSIYPNNKSFEIFNEEDLEIPYIPNAPIIPELKVNYYQNDTTNFIFNLLMGNKLPTELEVKTYESVIADFGYEVTLDKERVINILDEEIPDGYIEGESDDIPWFSWDIMSEVAIGNTKEEVCSLKNPFIKNNQYFIFYFGGNGYDDEHTLVGFDSYERFVREIFSIYNEVYTDTDYSSFMQECVDMLIDLVSNEMSKYKKDLINLGVSEDTFK